MSPAAWCVAFLSACAGSALAQEARRAGAPVAAASRPTAEPRAMAQPSAALARDAARAEYRRRASALEAGGAEGLVERRIELALWCQQHGLRAEVELEAQAVLAADPGHATAHRLLGHEEKDGQWLTHEEAMRARGYVPYRGQWLRKYDVAVLEYREEQTKQRARLEKELNDWFARLASSSSTSRAKALKELEARSERMEWPDLAVLARKQKAIYDAAWREYELTATVKLQSSKLQSLDTFTTSLGTGVPVQLQLPRLQSTSLGTTVVLPAGSGR